MPWLRLLAGVAAMAVLCSAAKPPACPQVEKTASGAHLKISSSLNKALAAAAPGFHPWTMSDYTESARKSYKVTKAQAPWAVVADFDGDGFCDLVVDGRTKTDTYRLCAWGSSEGPRVMTLARHRLTSAPGRSTAALTLVSKADVDRFIELAKGDSLIGVVFGEQAGGKLARLYYWRRGKFAQVDAK